jgi:hypothetical protein
MFNRKFGGLTEGGMNVDHQDQQRVYDMNSFGTDLSAMDWSVYALPYDCMKLDKVVYCSCFAASMAESK